MHNVNLIYIQLIILSMNIYENQYINLLSYCKTDKILITYQLLTKIT